MKNGETGKHKENIMTKAVAHFIWSLLFVLKLIRNDFTLQWSTNFKTHFSLFVLSFMGLSGIERCTVQILVSVFRELMLAVCCIPGLSTMNWNRLSVEYLDFNDFCSRKFDQIMYLFPQI